MLWNFFCKTATDALLDNFPSIFLTSENQMINEILKRDRYFKVVEDKNTSTRRRGKKEEAGAVSPNDRLNK